MFDRMTVLAVVEDEMTDEGLNDALTLARTQPYPVAWSVRERMVRVRADDVPEVVRARMILRQMSTGLPGVSVYLPATRSMNGVTVPVISSEEGK